MVKASVSQPQVSVLMPAWNRAPFVAAAVASVLEQTCGDLELLVIDDGSTDDTCAVLERIVDARLRRAYSEGDGLWRTTLYAVAQVLACTVVPRFGWTRRLHRRLLACQDWWVSR